MCLSAPPCFAVMRDPSLPAILCADFAARVRRRLPSSAFLLSYASAQQARLPRVAGPAPRHRCALVAERRSGRSCRSGGRVWLSSHGCGAGGCAARPM